MDKGEGCPGPTRRRITEVTERCVHASWKRCVSKGMLLSFETEKNWPVWKTWIFLEYMRGKYGQLLQLFTCCWDTATYSNTRHNGSIFSNLNKANTAHWSPVLSSARAEDILGHISTPLFSDDRKLLHFIAGQTNSLQVLLYAVNLILSRSVKSVHYHY